MKYLTFLLLAALLCACGPDDARATAPPGAESPAPAPAPYENLSPDEFAARMQDEDVVILDVRTPAEVAEGKIDGAVELDFNDPRFAAQLEALDPGPTYLVYCAAGGRSSKACDMMSEAGFQKVYNLEGGYTAWSQR